MEGRGGLRLHMQKAKWFFRKEAWLCSLDRELSENELIVKAGGFEVMENVLSQCGDFKFLSVIFDNPKQVRFVSHEKGHAIAAMMRVRGIMKYQTMEIRRRQPGK